VSSGRVLLLDQASGLTSTTHRAKVQPPGLRLLEPHGKLGRHCTPMFGPISGKTHALSFDLFE
jgi:hypothetical protein